VDRLRAELAECEAAKTNCASKMIDTEKRDRILMALGVGKQSAQYKKVKSVLDAMMQR
jgi:hypothetical protein